MKKAHYNFLRANVMSSNLLFCPTNSKKPKDIQFIITWDEEKKQLSQQIIEIADDYFFCRLTFNELFIFF